MIDSVASINLSALTKTERAPLQGRTRSAGSAWPSTSGTRTASATCRTPAALHSPPTRHSGAPSRRRSTGTLSRKWCTAGPPLSGCTPISPSSPSLNTTVPCTPYNPKDAKRLVAISGVASPTVHLLTSNTTTNLVLAQFIQAEEAAVGINVVIDPADNPTALARELSGSFDTAIERLDRGVRRPTATSISSSQRTARGTSAATRTLGST